MAQEGHAGFEMAGEFSTLEIGGFWDGHTPKTPPFVVPIRDRSYVQEFCVQHSLNLKMSGTETIKTTWNGCLPESDWSG
ncbi:hypothetical protein [Deinococcus soli (ex Cha et al. 2016)]|uniref:hypothetical protein n=1 Tax=Deinococcus soli (ex Cha et al. 2016) TaxID=1309411 RepID=UPI0012FF06D2|nr:hypothetical protein [Deinococcus soli (ex Cha et al. 2016)]